MDRNNEEAGGGLCSAGGSWIHNTHSPCDRERITSMHVSASKAKVRLKGKGQFSGRLDLRVEVSKQKKSFSNGRLDRRCDI